MKKIAILVETDFINKHVGVRNLIFSVYKSLLDIGVLVDFVSYDTYHGNSISWFKIWIDEPSIINNFANKDRHTQGKSSKLLHDYKYDSFQEILNSNTNEKVIFQRIGSEIELMGYSAMIISAPWVVANGFIPLNISLYGLVYDMIPNNYVIDKINKPFSFAYQHLNGYQFYVNQCNAILSISCGTKKAFDEYFPKADFKSFVLPPAVPNYLRKVKFHGSIRENNVILAGPWDVRKGLKRIPKILNSISNQINTLYIYGKPRCSSEDIRQFLEELSSLKNIVWYEEITNEALSSLYQKSKILLFPSENEGLGLPLIEAQMQGCRVVCTEFESAKEILVDGFYIMDEDDEATSKKIESILVEDYNYDELRNSSINFFSQQKMNTFLLKLIEGLK